MDGRQVMKAVLHYRATPGFRSKVGALENSELQIVIVDEVDRDTFDREMQDTDVLLHVLEPVRAATIAGAPRLRLIQKLGIGVDTIDLDAARRAGVAVCNMPGTNTRAVAELTLLLMLATLRRLVELDTETRAGKGWALDAAVLDELGELGGRTVGLVGFGAVGRSLTPMLHGVGARVLYTDVVADATQPATFASLHELLRSSDIVSLHVPLTPDTIQLMNEQRFASMKRGSILVNTARGGLVDQDALHRALMNGHVRGAALDVFAAEPADTSHPLFRLRNVIVTPHLAWFTAETLNRSLDVFAENCRRLRDGAPLLNRVV
jgi:phosphoglycerate dehydrogenase-like enzyme